MPATESQQHGLARLQSLPEGEYRVLVMDLDTCNSHLDCAVVAMSGMKKLSSSQALPYDLVTMQVTYAAVELGLRFVRCPEPGSQCVVPAYGVAVRINQTDVRGSDFSYKWPGNSVYVVDSNGYLLFGVFKSKQAAP